MSTPIGPVTLGGLYENTDGTVSRYTWRGGHLDCDWTEPTWAAASERRESERRPDAGPDEDHYARERRRLDYAEKQTERARGRR